MTEKQRTGNRCQYCNKPTSLEEMYYGTVAQCECGAYVSVDNDGNPKGCTAKNELRRLRRSTHKYIDRLVHMKVEKSKVSKEDAKEALYAYLNKTMNYNFEFKSIAQLNELEIIELQNILKNIIENAERKRKERSEAA